VVFDGTLEPGQSYNVPNVPGLVLRTGHASSLIIRVDGHAVPAIEGDRHDIALDPQALLAGAAVRD
jgi:cytoskeleton protein RodZ